MDRPYQEYLPLALKLLITALVLAFFYFFGVRLLQIALPFFMGWLIALIIEPFTRLLEAWLKIRRKWSSLIGVCLFVAFLLGAMGALGTILVVQLMAFSEYVPQYATYLFEESQQIALEIGEYIELIPPTIGDRLLSASDALVRNLTGLLSNVVTSLVNVITRVPEFIVFIVVTIISGYFISVDRKRVYAFLLAQIPPAWFPKLKIIKEDLLVAVGGYVRAQLILMVLTFFISLIGLWITQIEFAFLIALVASLLDALPILGTGLVYVPIVIWQLIEGNYLTALFVALVNLAALLLRRFVEPKLLATQIGFHPLSILLFMYGGLRLFGFIGMILGPILLILLLALQKAELIPRWRNPDKPVQK